ncbi:MAG: ABC transporter substrate-binding protein [Acidimicrobiales bacterium]
MIALAMLLAVALLAAACGSSSTSTGTSTNTTEAPTGVSTNISPDEGTPKDGGSLAFGLEAETDSLNPATGRWAISGHMMGSSIFDPLATLDADGHVVPYLAQSFDHNADYTTWTINLRDGVKFQDGTPVDGAAVSKALNVYQEALITGAAMKQVGTIQASGPLTVTITTTQPWGDLPNVFVAQAGYIAAPAMLDNPFGGDNPIGSGPFTFREWAKGDHVTVVKNQSYWQAGLPHLDQIKWVPIPDSEDRLAALENGTINAMDTVTPQTIDSVRANPDLSYAEYSNGEELHVPLNTKKAPFDNLKARQAVAYATDQATYISQLGQGVYTPANGMFAPGQLGYNEDSGYPQFDLDKAKQLVQEYEAETGKPLEFTLLAVSEVQYAQQDQLLKQMWEAAGMKVTLDSQAQADQIIQVILGNYQAADFRLFGQPEPDSDFYWWSSGTVAPVGGVSLNMARFANATTDAALAKGRENTDEAVRNEAYQAFEKEWNANVPDIWLARTDWMIASDKTVHGYLPALNGSIASVIPKTWIADLWIG